MVRRRDAHNSQGHFSFENGVVESLNSADRLFQRRRQAGAKSISITSLESSLAANVCMHPVSGTFPALNVLSLLRLPPPLASNVISHILVSPPSSSGDL